jgi:hypothetical protein
VLGVGRFPSLVAGFENRSGRFWLYITVVTSGAGEAGKAGIIAAHRFVYAMRGGRFLLGLLRKPLKMMVGAARFELATPSPPDWCANRAALRSDARKPVEIWGFAAFTRSGRKSQEGDERETKSRGGAQSPEENPEDCSRFVLLHDSARLHAAERQKKAA